MIIDFNQVMRGSKTKAICFQLKIRCMLFNIDILILHSEKSCFSRDYYFILKYDTIPLHFKWYVSSFLEIPIVVLNSKIFMVLFADIFITICLDELWFTVFSEHSDSIFFPFYDLFLRSGAGLRDCLLFLTYPYL